MAVTRNPMAGRHAVGGKTASPGGIRSGQSAHTANGVGTGHNQKTGVPASSPSRTMKPKPGVLANQAETSRDLERRLRGRAPQPFANKGGAATLAAPTHSSFGSTGNAKEAQQQYGGGNKYSVCSGTSLDAEMMAAVGYGPKATRSDNPIISGNPFKGNQRQAGRPGNVNKGASAKDSQRVRQTGY